MQREDQHIDLPDLIDEWQAERSHSPNQIHCDGESPARRGYNYDYSDRYYDDYDRQPRRHYRERNRHRDDCYHRRDRDSHHREYRRGH